VIQIPLSAVPTSLPVADKLRISGTHWLMPNVGTLAKDGNSYVFATEE